MNKRFKVLLLLICATSFSLNKVRHLCSTDRVTVAHKCAAFIKKNKKKSPRSYCVFSKMDIISSWPQL